jgi:sucrose phosphorylase
LARAIQLFMPGTPQVWYLDLFAGANDDEAADRGGSGGHKEINRTNLTADDVDAGLAREVVLDQLEMLRLRNTSDAFDGELDVIATASDRLALRWRNGETSAMLEADLATATFTITHVQAEQQIVLVYN